MTTPAFLTSAIVRASERLVLRGGGWRSIDIPVRYGLWLHPQMGPTLIDTGYGPRVTEGRRRSLALKAYSAALSPRLLPEGAALAQLQQRGLRPADVRHIVVSHFHADHIAALRDFPAARFIASRTAFEPLAAMNRWQQLRHGFFAELLPPDFARRLIAIERLSQVDLPQRLGRGVDLFDDGSCLAVPLPGHAIGHFGLLWPAQGLLYAADTQWLQPAITENRAPAGPARLIYADPAAVSASVDKVRRFAALGGTVILCHEPAHGDAAAGPAP